MRGRDDLVVLCYHAVSETWPADISITPDRLERQLKFLIGRGYKPFTLSDALAPEAEGKRFVATFDDAFTSVLEVGKPVMDELGVPGTLFVPTHMVGTGRPMAWPGIDHWRGGEHEHELIGMSWEQIGSMRDAGWEIGAHTRTHPRLTRLDDAAALEELAGSKEDVQARLGGPCPTLAYPYGDVDHRIEALTGRAGFSLAVGLSSKLDAAPRALQWPRIGIYHADDMRRFRLKASPASRRLRSTAAWGTLASKRRSRGAEERVADTAPMSVARSPGEPRVAVIIPCYGDGATVTETVHSIEEPEPVEVVIIDDGSPDEETKEVLSRLEEEGVRVVRHEQNQGLPAARNTGLASTSAPFVFPLDSDDLAVPGALTALADRLERAPEAAACYGDVLIFGPHEKVRTFPPTFDPFMVAYRNRYPVASMFRRSVLEEVGGWKDVGGMVGYEDWSLWMTLAERRKEVVYLGQGLLTSRYRVHGERMFKSAARKHPLLYQAMVDEHPQLFAEIKEHRRRSTLNPVMRMAYPYLFGARQPRGIGASVEKVLDRVRGRRPAA